VNKANLFTPIWITLAVLLALAACQPYTVEPQGGAQVLVPAGTVTLEPYPPPPSQPRRATLPPDWRPTMDTSIVMLTPRPAATPCSPEDKNCLPGRGTPWPTPEGGFEPTWTPPPSPTRPPLLLTPIPKGEPPAHLWSILYLPLDDDLAVYGVLISEQGTRWSDPQVVYDFRNADPGPHTRLTQLDASPDGKWLAVAVAYLESSKIWLLDLMSREPHLVSACKEYQSCGILDWSPDGNAIILERFPPTLYPSNFVIVDAASDTTTDLHVPDTTLDRPFVREVVFSPDGYSIAWVIGNQGRGAPHDDDEMTQVWLTDSEGGRARLLTSEAGGIWNLAWHPNNLQVAYSFAVEKQRADRGGLFGYLRVQSLL
jgi:WD40 repeat protein